MTASHDDPDDPEHGVEKVLANQLGELVAPQHHFFHRLTVQTICEVTYSGVTFTEGSVHKSFPY